MNGKQKSQKLMDYELMMDVFNRVPAEARPGGKYGLVAGFGYAGDYPTKGDVTTPRQFGQKLPGMLSPPIRSKGGGRVAGFYTLPEFDPSVNPINRSQTLFPLENFPEKDQVYYQDILNAEQYERVNNNPERTIMHEFFHRGATKLPLKELAEFSKKKGDDLSTRFFTNLQTGEGQHFFLKTLDAYMNVGGDEDRLSSLTKKRLKVIEDANNIIREFMTPEKQKELGLRIPLKESKPKKEGLFDRLFK